MFLSILNPTFCSGHQKNAGTEASVGWMEMFLGVVRARKTLRTAEKMRNLIQETLLEGFQQPLQLCLSPGSWGIADSPMPSVQSTLGTSSGFGIAPSLQSGSQRDSFSGPDSGKIPVLLWWEGSPGKSSRASKNCFWKVRKALRGLGGALSGREPAGGFIECSLWVSTQ